MPPLPRERDEIFCREVAGGLSLRAAWMMAGFPPNSHNSWKFSKRKRIRARIHEIQSEFAREDHIHLRYIQDKLLVIINADITNYVEQDRRGRISIKNLADLPSELRPAISEVRVDANGQAFIKLEPRTPALQLLLKTMPGAFAPERVDVGFDMLSERLDKAMARNAQTIDVVPESAETLPALPEKL
jgi:hypothetical protein